MLVTSSLQTLLAQIQMLKNLLIDTGNHTRNLTNELFI